MNATAIETHALSKRYGSVRALEGLELTVRPHSIFGFLGPNGAGKSTTMKLLLGLARPSTGSARVFGLDVVADSLAVRGRIGYLPQEQRFYDYQTARQTLRFAARFFLDDETDIERRVQASLELVGLADKGDRPVRGLSGGERQRLGLAQAQIHDPDLLILDEPAASLDPAGRHDVLTILERLRERATVFYSTHILDDVQRVSDEVAILARGSLVAQAPIAALLSGQDGVAYGVTLRGPADGVRARLAAEPWVRGVTVMDGATARAGDEAGRGGTVTLQVAVTDADAAEARLLRVALEDPGVTVTDFRRRTFELEDVFLQLTGGTDHGAARAS